MSVHPRSKCQCLISPSLVAVFWTSHQFGRVAVQCTMISVRSRMLFPILEAPLAGLGQISCEGLCLENFDSMRSQVSDFLDQLSKTVLVLFPPLVSHRDFLLEHLDGLLICQHGTHQPAKRTHRCKAKGKGKNSDRFFQYSSIHKSCYFNGRILCPIMTISVPQSPPSDDGLPYP